MERTHSKIPIEQFNKPVFQYFLNKNHIPESIKKTINIPGGRINGVNIFLKKNIPRSIILYQAILYINLGAVIDPKIKSVIPCLTRNPDAVPAKAGNYKELGSCFHRNPWIPAFAGMTFSCFFVSQRLMSIPAKAGIQIEKTGFRIKSGMTKSMKSFVGQDTIR